MFRRSIPILNALKLASLLSGILFCLMTSEAESAGPSRAMMERARVLRHDGEKYLQIKKFDIAIKSFSQAYILFPSPAILLLLGRSLLENGQHREAGELCQRYLQEQPAATDAYIAKMCRDMALSLGSGYSLIDISSLPTMALHDLNLADAHMLLGDYVLAEKFADHFLSEVRGSQSARRYAIRILRTARGFLGKIDPYAPGRRPLWRKVLGTSSMVAGLGLLAWGGSILALEGHCVGNYDADRYSDLSCQSIYSNLSYGVPLLVVGSAALFSGITLVALPGPRAERELALTPSPTQNSVLTLHF